jgi:hypothetical protein
MPIMGGYNFDTISSLFCVSFHERLRGLQSVITGVVFESRKGVISELGPSC